MKQPHKRAGGTRLPPAGHARQEELRRRKDVLEEEIDERTAGQEFGGGKHVKIENEIAQHMSRLGDLPISNPEPGYVYCWCETGNLNRRSLTLGMKLGVEKWEVVQGDMQEAVEHKGVGADTTRRVGDVILLRLRKDRYIALQRYYRDLNVQRELGIASGIVEAVEAHNRRRGKREAIIHTDISDPLVQRALKRSQARGLASQQLDRQLREGTAHLPHGTA